MRGHRGAPRAYDSLNESAVFVLKLTPEMNPSIFNLLKRDYDAVILETFGIGGIPDYGDYRRAIFGWVDSGRTLVVTTQVPEEAATWACTRSGALMRDIAASSRAAT